VHVKGSVLGHVGGDLLTLDLGAVLGEALDEPRRATDLPVGDPFLLDVVVGRGLVVEVLLGGVRLEPLVTTALRASRVGSLGVGIQRNDSLVGTTGSDGGSGVLGILLEEKPPVRVDDQGGAPGVVREREPKSVVEPVVGRDMVKVWLLSAS